MNEFNKKEPWEMTLQEYADSIMNDPTQAYLSKENNIKEFNEYKQLLYNLLAKRIKPSSVIGTGYINPRKVAIEWLEQRIAEYKSIIDGTTIHCVIKANYESHLLTRSRILHGTYTP